MLSDCYYLPRISLVVFFKSFAFASALGIGEDGVHTASESGRGDDGLQEREDPARGAQGDGSRCLEKGMRTHH